MEKVIEVENLKKRYGDFKAVDGISFDVYKNEIFGLLGENGAGKTTTLEMIEGLRKPTSGKITVLGHNPNGEIDLIKEKIGVQLQSSAYFNFLNLREILDLFGSFYNKQLDPDELLNMVDLETKKKSLVNKLSGGQKQRFSIVASLVNDPEIVFLDEPTTGLDPLARRNLWNLITKIKEQGKTIILTTHYMEEAEILCDRVAIMEKGKIMVMDETHKLINKAKNPYKISFIGGLDNKEKSYLSELGNLEMIAKKKDNFELCLNSQEKVKKALALIHQKEMDSITVGKASLEDVFIEYTGRAIVEEENA